MSTRSLIGKMREDGTVEAVYCHHDGYPEGVGRTLSDFYGEREVDALLALGDVSSLGEEPVSDPSMWKGPFGSASSDFGCPSYRDRGEKGTDAKTYPDDEAYVRAMPDRGVEWAYLFCDSEWLVSDGSGWKRLDDELEG